MEQYSSQHAAYVHAFPGLHETAAPHNNTISKATGFVNAINNSWSVRNRFGCDTLHYNSDVDWFAAKVKDIISIVSNVTASKSCSYHVQQKKKIDLFQLILITFVNRLATKQHPSIYDNMSNNLYTETSCAQSVHNETTPGVAAFAALSKITRPSRLGSESPFWSYTNSEKSSSKGGSEAIGKGNAEQQNPNNDNAGDSDETREQEEQGEEQDENQRREEEKDEEEEEEKEQDEIETEEEEDDEEDDDEDCASDPEPKARVSKRVAVNIVIVHGIDKIWKPSVLRRGIRDVTCHRCKVRKPMSVLCGQAGSTVNSCTVKFCEECLQLYGETFDKVATAATWYCPSCRKECNCIRCNRLSKPIVVKENSIENHLISGLNFENLVPNKKRKRGRKLNKPNKNESSARRNRSASVESEVVNTKSPSRYNNFEKQSNKVKGVSKRKRGRPPKKSQLIQKATKPKKTPKQRKMRATTVLNGKIYKVDKIIASRKTGTNTTQYLVKWQNSTDCSWETRKSLRNNETISKYEKVGTKRVRGNTTSRAISLDRCKYNVVLREFPIEAAPKPKRTPKPLRNLSAESPKNSSSSGSSSFSPRSYSTATPGGRRGRRMTADFNINNITLPQVSHRSITLPSFKEIYTPKWQQISLDINTEDLSSSDEDTSDEAYEQRHKPYENKSYWETMETTGCMSFCNQQEKRKQALKDSNNDRNKATKDVDTNNIASLNNNKKLRIHNDAICKENKDYNSTIASTGAPSNNSTDLPATSIGHFGELNKHCSSQFDNTNNGVTARSLLSSSSPIKKATKQPAFNPIEIRIGNREATTTTTSTDIESGDPTILPPHKRRCTADRNSSNFYKLNGSSITLHESEVK